MAAGFHGASPWLLGRAGVGVYVPPVVVSPDVQSPLDGSSSFSLTTALLGTTIFDRAPITWDTVQKMKDVSSQLTWSASVYEEWPVISGANGVIGIERELKWPIMAGSLFLVLRSYFESTQQIIWNPGRRARTPGEKYYITFVSLDTGKDHRTEDYVYDVVAKFNIRGIAP
jgi:hypothetical protein